MPKSVLAKGAWSELDDRVMDPRDHGVQFGIHSEVPHEVNLTTERAKILPMIGAAADMVDTFRDQVFNQRVTDSHAATPRG